jgi:alkanesulfonate monooxygenase SsuD/methylene tetrahydromethanopterin reductase-like flavin-dependent oxidoreductase (luciferase family)
MRIAMPGERRGTTPERHGSRTVSRSPPRTRNPTRSGSAIGSSISTAGISTGATNAEPSAPSPESYRENELIGTPDEVFAALEPMSKALGTTDLVVNGPASGLDWRREGYESVKLFADEVLPRLKALG